MTRILQRLLSQTKGATAVEYGLIIALIILAMLAALTVFASATIDMWGNVSDAVTNA